MGALTKFELNSKGIRAMLRSAEVEADMLRRAERVAAAAGEGFEASSYVGSGRASARVITATGDAMRDEAENKTLTRSFGAARG